MHRYIRSPLTEDQLSPLASDCRIVQFDKQLTEYEYKKLAEFLKDYPNVGIRAYGLSRDIPDLSFLRHFSSLRKFYMDIRKLESFDGLSFLPIDLEELGISQTYTKQQSLLVLKRFPNLKSLYIEGYTKDINIVGKLENLKKLSLRSISLPDLSLFLPLKRLESLEIKLGGIKDLSLLPKVGQIKYLELWLIRGLTDISTISDLESLQYLFLQALKHITCLPDMKRLSRLRRLHLETMKGINDLTPLVFASALEELMVVDMPQLKVESFTPLIGHPTLKKALIRLGSIKKNNAVDDMLKLPRFELGKHDFIFV